MSRHLPPLNALRVFETAARQAGITRAAEELCVSQGAVSRHIAQLEQWLGVKLFIRMHRGITLTPQGSTYFRAIKDALDIIESSSQKMRNSPDDHQLKLKLPPTFAMRWLVPRLAKFHAKYPQIDVQITTSHQDTNFDKEDIDIGIYSWATPPIGANYQRLFGEELLIVCAPSLLTQGHKLKQPEDLAHHSLLCSLNRPFDWPTWLAVANITNFDGNRGLKFENAALAYQAAIDGLGVMLAQVAFVTDDLRTGRLISPLSLRVKTQRGYYLAQRPGQTQPARVKAFETWVMEEAQSLESS